MPQTTARYRRERSKSGQTLVELALAIPLLFLLFVAMVYFGKAFYVKQVLVMAAQEGARQACRVPNLNDPAVRDAVRGFTTTGQETNQNSVIHAMIASARLLSSGSAGNLPPGSKVKILPWDSEGSQEDFTPPGTIAVRIEYPFVFAGDPFTGQSNFGTIAIWSGEGGSPIDFPSFQMSERAVACQEVYQEVN